MMKWFNKYSFLKGIGFAMLLVSIFVTVQMVNINTNSFEEGTELMELYEKCDGNVQESECHLITQYSTLILIGFCITGFFNFLSILFIVIICMWERIYKIEKRLENKK